MTGTITYDDEDDDPEIIGLTAIAEYNFGGGKAKIRYKEYPEHDTNKDTDDYISNLITINSNDKITLAKSSKNGISSILLLEKDARHTCVYNTPFGSFVMGIFTTSLIIEASENECRISALYTTDIEKENVRHHKLEISVKEKTA